DHAVRRAHDRRRRPRDRPARRPRPAHHPRRPAVRRAAQPGVRPDPEGQDGEAMTLLDTGTFVGELHGDAPIVEPATGAELGRTGVADAADVTRACAQAAAAQRDWANASFEERAGLLRKAGTLIE